MTSRVSRKTTDCSLEWEGEREGTSELKVGIDGGDKARTLSLWLKAVPTTSLDGRNGSDRPAGEFPTGVNTVAVTQGGFLDSWSILSACTYTQAPRGQTLYQNIGDMAESWAREQKRECHDLNTTVTEIGR